MREIVLDTETTGLDPSAGHRIVEIGCVELVNHVPTGEIFHCYVNPERDIPVEAERVHGLTIEFLSTHPIFATVAADFLGFIGDATLVAHNASFDIGFINAELVRAGHPPVSTGRAVDTVAMARRKFPGAQASLDALCRRFGIDLTGRELHGALLDARLLAAVYLELKGGRQHGLDLAQEALARHLAETPTGPAIAAGRRMPRPHDAFDEEKVRHAALLAKFEKPIWLSE
ncbi:MAG: DNA polymerase III subunit epsilon [Proteobacteria bacterium]|nr:DNA polymerase III subunit epsilon [Pseudomonadota bacterium]